jgi:septum formation protein
VRLLLASTSPYRRAQLERLSLTFTQRAPNVDEDVLMGSGQAPETIALALARAKAEALGSDDSFVLGGDQLVALDDDILGKPGSAAAARAQLGRLAGRTHRLISAYALRAPDGHVDADVHVHEMTVRALTAEEIARYVEADSPLDCCGSYRIEALGISLFESIRGDDPSAIEGLPLMSVCAALRRAGFPVP